MRILKYFIQLDFFNYYFCLIYILLYIFNFMNFDLEEDKNVNNIEINKNKIKMMI